MLSVPVHPSIHPNTQYNICTATHSFNFHCRSLIFLFIILCMESCVRTKQFMCGLSSTIMLKFCATLKNMEEMLYGGNYVEPPTGISL